jgi:hypothetical protein
MLKTADGADEWGELRVANRESRVASRGLRVELLAECCGIEEAGEKFWR